MIDRPIENPPTVGFRFQCLIKTLSLFFQQDRHRLQLYYGV